MVYKELDGIDFIFYYNKHDDRIWVTDIRNKTKFTDNGGLWFEGAYGNCLIRLCNQKSTDRLYLISRDRVSDIYNAGFYNANIEHKIEIIEILEKYANKIVERGTERHSHIVVERE